MSFSTPVLAILFGVASRLPVACGQAPTNLVAGDCALIIVADHNTRVELGAQDVVRTETPGTVTLTVVNPQRLAAIQQLTAPVVTFCYHGHRLKAHGNPLLSSAVPKGAAAFYALTNDQKISLATNRFQIGIVSELTRKKN